MMPSLRARFEAFVKTLDGFESVDALLRDNDPQGKKRADYLFADRTIIVEQKILDVDPVAKPTAFLEKVMKERGIGGYGLVSSKQIFAKLADGAKLNRDLVLLVSRRVEKNVQDADKQTRDTRTIFGINNAAGVLIMLNEKASALPPDIVAYRLAHAFERKKADGSPEYPHNDAVITINEAHPIRHPGAAKAFTMSAFQASHRRQSERVTRFANELMDRWAAFNNVPLMQGEWRRSAERS